MKCSACNYEYEKEYEKNFREKIIKGDDPFILITGMFLVQNSGWNAGKHEVNLFACPKCQTVRLED